MSWVPSSAKCSVTRSSSTHASRPIQNPLIPGTGSQKQRRYSTHLRGVVPCTACAPPYVVPQPQLQLLIHTASSPFSRPLPGVNHAPTGPLAYTCLVAMTRDTPPWWCISGDTDADEGGPELLVRRLVHEEDLGALQQNVQVIRRKSIKMPTALFHLSPKK